MRVDSLLPIRTLEYYLSHCNATKKFPRSIRGVKKLPIVVEQQRLELRKTLIQKHTSIEAHYSTI